MRIATNIQEKATTIVEQIWHQSAESTTHFEEKLTKEEFVELCSWVLQYYGGRTGHEFLLKFHRSFIQLTVNELREMIDNMTYKKSFGIHTLLGFYVQYTTVRDDELLRQLGVTDKSFSNATTPEEFTKNPFINGTIEKLALTDEEIQTIRHIQPVFEVTEKVA